MWKPLFALTAMLAWSAAVLADDTLAPVEDAPTAPVADLAPATAPSDVGERFWIAGEYLFWELDDGPLEMPLATVGPTTGLGVLGRFGTQTLFGNRDIEYGTASGGRLSGGYWFDRGRRLGVEAGGFILGEETERQDVRLGRLDSGVALARPFFDTSIGRENVRIVSLPGAFDGQFFLASESQLAGADAGGVWRAYNQSIFQVDVTGGFRYVYLRESLEVGDTSRVLNNGVSSFRGVQAGPGSTLTVTDSFRAQNDFLGGYFGGRLWVDCAPFFFSLSGRLGLGTVRQELDVAGSTTLARGVTRLTSPGGLLATAPNSGSQSRDTFAVAPELDFKAALRFSKNVNLHVGYGFLYISEVVRPGDQLSRMVNPTLIPTAPNFGVPFTGRGTPAGATFNTSDYFAHGLNVGVSFVY